MLKFNKTLIVMFIITLMMFVLVTGCGQNSAPKTEDNQQQSEEQANEANVSYELKWGTAAAGGAWHSSGRGIKSPFQI
jgi:outer membrane lipoprotein-sorting protein